ncbi:MAG: MBOAT family O-acyltransferase [Coriobacteriales bacterium]|nr:MBOAT family O-acyltransferase [Coriobacteriales bacterium]
MLLVASYAFLYHLSGRVIGFTLVTTLSVYALGLGMGRVYEARDGELAQVKRGKKAIKERYKKRARWVLVAGIAINMGILFALNYLGFFGKVTNAILGLFSMHADIRPLRIGTPLGISFYTLMAVSYLVDVYRETIKPDRHLGRVALFLSFFPQIMEGPICRYGQTAQALTEGKPLTRAGLYEGSVRMLVGFVMKLVIADRLNSLVGMIFKSYNHLDGGVIMLGAVFYTLQLYCDFAGTMHVALGMGRFFGVTLPENFRQPFFSKTASEFWQRWHITLGAWFKDYVFYPVSFSKLCKSLSTKARKRFGRQIGPLLVSSIALFCVWFGNGLWHGAGTQYLLFGMYYFVLIVAGGFLEIPAQAFAAKHELDRDKGLYAGLRVARTLCLIFVGELMFRSDSARDAFAMLARMVTNFSFEGIANGALFGIHFVPADLAIALLTLVGVFALDAVKERGGTPLASLCSKSLLVRWGVWFALFMFVLIFGAYGAGYVPVDPMYAQF